MKKLALCIVASTVLLSNFSLAKSFENKYFKDGYSFRLEGLSSIVSVNKSNTIATGQLLSDGAGNVIGNGSFRSSGITCVGSIAGTYKIEPNGFGLISTTISTKTPGCSSQQVNLEMVLSDQGVVVDVASSDNHDMVGKLTRHGKEKFNYGDLNGAYAMHLEGTSAIVSSEQSFTTILGVLAANGNGLIGGTGLLRSSGVVCHGIFSGTYVLLVNGTGSILTKFTPTDPGCYTRHVNLNIALYKKGNGVEISSSDNDYLTGSLGHQFPKK